MCFHARTPALHDGHVHPFRAALEGTLAGLLAAMLVAVAHAFSDALADDLLRTPLALASLLFEADGAGAVDGILLFSALHVSLWIGAGIASAYAIAVADAHPRALGIVFALLLFGWISLLYLSDALSHEAGDQ